MLFEINYLGNFKTIRERVVLLKLQLKNLVLFLISCQNLSNGKMQKNYFIGHLSFVRGLKETGKGQKR
jgi:hypothetical protein